MGKFILDALCVVGLALNSYFIGAGDSTVWSWGAVVACSLAILTTCFSYYLENK